MTVTYGAGWTMSPAQLLRERVNNLWRIGSECIEKLRSLVDPQTEEQHVEAFMERIKLVGVLTMLETLDAEPTIAALVYMTAVHWTMPDGTEEINRAADFITYMQPRPEPSIELPGMSRESWEQFAAIIDERFGVDIRQTAIALSAAYPDITPEKWSEWAQLLGDATTGPEKLQ